MLQHIWIHRQDGCSLSTYQEFIEKIKITPRQWNLSVNINQIMKYVSWVLGIPINMVKFKRKRPEHKMEFICSHQCHCYIPCYKFNNPYIKLCNLSRKEFLPINILEFQSKYYSIPAESCNPILINKQPSLQLDNISKNDVRNILHGNPVKIPFMVVLYSTPAYVRAIHTKIISQNVIKVLENNSSKMINLFITPRLNSDDFDVYQLESLSQNPKKFNKKNNFNCSRPTEGNPIFKSKDNLNKTLLNQDNCMCDHPDTDRYYAPNKRTFKPLGKL